MLSDREREELARIEQRLMATDRHLATAFSSGRRPFAQRRWPVRVLLGFGVFLLVVAVLTGAGELFVQGLLCVAGGIGWQRWRARQARGGAGTDAADPGRTRPDGMPPGWFRPV